MKFFGKIFKNKSLVTLVALIICLVILFFAYRYRVNTAINAINVPIAKETITSRTEITKDMIKTVKVADAMITTNVIRNESDIIGKFVNYNTFIPTGSLFYKSAVVDWKEMPDASWSDIKDGYTIVSLSVNDRSTYGNSIFPGDKIDLYYENNMEKPFLGPIITGIEVLAVKDANGGHIFKKSADQRAASALIFAVPDDIFALLQKAASIGGNIIPLIKNSSYNIDIRVEENTIKDFIETNSADFEQDFTNDSKVEKIEDTKVIE